MLHDTDSQQAPQPARGRFYTVFVVIAIALVLILVRYGTIMLGAGGESVGQQTTASERGPILDRYGRILAIQTDLETIWAWRPEVEDPAQTALELSTIVDMEPAEIERRLTGPTGSATIKRTVSPAESDAIRAAQAEGRVQGIRLRPDSGRSYPEQDSLAGVIGFVGDEGRGLEGIEFALEPFLHPEDGLGNQVFLTIDMAMQYEAERLANATLDRYNADSVVLLAMDTQSGDLLAYASSPSFDPNRFSEFSEDERRNRPVADVYEPGSVFKIFSIGSFLQLGAITPATLYETTGSYNATDPPITDLGNYGTIDTADIIRLSSNVGAALASEEARERDFYTMLRLFGFGEQTGVGMSGEEAGILARPDRWSGRTKPTIAIGQEIAVTALQLASAATVFANEGILIKPNIIDRIVAPSGETISNYGRTPVREVVSPAVAREILLAMEQAVSGNGTARRLEYEGLRIAAKTGTAEQLDPETGTYSQSAFIASTLALLPVPDPSIVLYVAIDYPKEGEFLGGRVATPVLREFLEFLVPYLGIPLEGEEPLVHPGRIVVQPIALPPLTETVPDYTGLPKRTLLPLLTHENVEVELAGYGWVVRQDPPAGSPFRDGMTIRLELE